MSAYLFGPVPSRRLGRSLGIDLVPFKTCTYDCVYCQLGRTTNRTCERREWVPTGAVIEQVRERLGRASAAIDTVTFSGSGEPTLHAGIGEILRAVKPLVSVPVAVLTNGSLLWRKDVQDDLLAADLVIPSLDAPDRHLFQRVNRPDPGLDFETMLEGLVRFRERFSGRLELEIMLLAGVTGIESEVRRLARLASSVRPDRVQLLTVTRPPQEEFAQPVPEERMERLARLFDVPVEVVPAAAPDPLPDAAFSATREQVLEMLARRPCTVQDISAGLGIPRAEAGKHVEDLFARGRVQTSLCNGERFYKTARA